MVTNDSSTTPAVFYVTFVVPSGSPLRIDRPAPACSAMTRAKRQSCPTSGNASELDSIDGLLWPSLPSRDHATTRRLHHAG
jgi:hypothetical protein